MGVRGCQCVASRSFFITGGCASDESSSEFSSAELASSICRLARGVLKAESELSDGEAGVAGDAALASIESSVHDVVVSSFTESTPSLPFPFVAGGSRLLSSLGNGEPPFVGAVNLGSLPRSSGCKSDTILCVHSANSTMCGDHFLPQPFCSLFNLSQTFLICFTKLRYSLAV